jgi:multiple sugar transport system substrate-binding protein
MIELKGTTWDHPRGLGGLTATVAAYQACHPEVRITWVARTLQDFADFSVERLAGEYDLLVFDHPFIGAGARSDCLAPLDDYLPAEYLAEQAASSVGASHASYAFEGRQWALAVDAACHVSAYRPDLLARLDREVPRTWDEVRQLAQAALKNSLGMVIPLIPVDAFMCIYSLCANAGEPPCRAADYFVSRVVGRHALTLLRELHALSHPRSRMLNPPAMLNAMATGDELVYCPLTFGYSNYARTGFGKHLIRFGAIPASEEGPVGAILGGAGLGISRSSPYPQAAAQYAAYAASPEIQSTLYVDGGGQPGHRSAWLDSHANEITHNFFLDTLETIDHSYLRPRFAGYVKMQDQAFALAFRFLTANVSIDHTLDDLDELYRASLAES